MSKVQCLKWSPIQAFELIVLLAVLLLVPPGARAQDRPLRKATQAEVNAGTVENSYVAPETLAGWTGAGPMIGLGVPNLKSNQVQYLAWQTTNFLFSTLWTTNTTNGWNFAEIGFTNGNSIFHNGTGFGFAIRPILLTNGANARFVVSVTVPPNLPIDQNGITVGFMTNSSTSIPANDAQLFGFGINSAATWARYRNTSITVEKPSWGTLRATNTTYNVCVTSDPTNISFCVVYPGHTNEVRAMCPWTSIGNLVISNFCLEFLCTNLVFNPAGGRVAASQTISPRTSIEGVSDFVTWSTDQHGDKIRVAVPAQYDSGTNIGNLIVFVHGNTGSYSGDYDSQMGDEAQTNDNVAGYFNALATNNFILASYQGDAASPGKTDTWGTTNSLDCIDAIIGYVRQRYAFSNIFLWGESAGGTSALNYAGAKREKIAGILMNHAVYSISNIYSGLKADIDIAYGGSTAGEFANTDPRGQPITAFAGIPIRVTASTGDTVVTKTNQTDLLVLALGGVVGGNATNTAMTPEIDDFSVNGPAGFHGGACYTPEVAAGDIAFLQRCLRYATRDVSAIGGDQRIFGVVRAGAVTSDNYVSQMYTNTTVPPLGTNAFYLWNSNGISSTNAFFMTVNSNGVAKTYHLSFQP